MHKQCREHFDTGHHTHTELYCTYSVQQYTQARAGSKDGTVSDRLTWGLVSTLSHFDLFTIPFVSEKPSQYSQKKTIPQCNVIFVSNTSYKVTFMGMMNCRAVSIKPVQTESINYQVQLKNPAFKVCSVQKGWLLRLLGILIRPLRKKAAFMNLFTTRNMDKSQDWKQTLESTW